MKASDHQPAIYLAGPIFQQSDSGCRGWRDEARQRLTWATVLDPMDRDYRGAEQQNSKQIVNGDLADIRSADALLANVSRPSWGTAMEIYYAHTIGVPVVGFGITAETACSPWLIHYCEEITETMIYAVSVLHRLRTVSFRLEMP